MVADKREILVVIETEFSGLYECGDITYPQWWSDLTQRHPKVIEVVEECIGASPIRWESIGVVTRNFATLRPDVLLALLEDVGPIRWLAAYRPIVHTASYDRRLVAAAAHWCSLVKQGFHEVVLTNGVLAMRSGH